MSEEEIEELMDYNLEYLEARNNEDIFGGDYTSSVDLKYANKEIEQLQEENKQLKEKYDELSKVYERMYNINCKAREYIENFKNIRVYLEYSDLDGYIEYDYDENFKQDILKILRGDSNE